MAPPTGISISAHSTYSHTVPSTVQYFNICSKHDTLKQSLLSERYSKSITNMIAEENLQVEQKGWDDYQQGSYNDD